MGIQTEIEINNFLNGVDGTLSISTRIALSKIIKQFESCNYVDEGIHSITDNVAFLALKKMAGEQ